MILMEPLRADYKIWSQYKYIPLSQQIDSDIIVIYSEVDSPKETVEGWKSITTGTTEMYEFGDSHFFLYEYYSDMASIINQALLS